MKQSRSPFTYFELFIIKFQFYKLTFSIRGHVLLCMANIDVTEALIAPCALASVVLAWPTHNFLVALLATRNSQLYSQLARPTQAFVSPPSHRLNILIHALLYFICFIFMYSLIRYWKGSH